VNRPWVPSPDVVVRAQDDRAFLLDLVSGRYFSLNPAGAVAWQALSDGTDPVAALTEAYPEIDPLRLEADWISLRDTLVGEGLVRTGRPA
jgi:Coenzyme PQQ synthesis protein D (PqqD)